MLSTRRGLLHDGPLLPGAQDCWQPPASPDTPGQEEPEPTVERIAAHRRDHPKVARAGIKIWPTSTEESVRC